MSSNDRDASMDTAETGAENAVASAPEEMPAYVNILRGIEGHLKTISEAFVRLAERQANNTVQLPSTSQHQSTQPARRTDNDTDLETFKLCGVCRSECDEMYAIDRCGHYPYCLECLSNMSTGSAGVCKGLKLRCPQCNTNNDGTYLVKLL